MKINVGPYVSFLGPYQLAEKILFWRDKYKDESVHNFGTWLANDKNGNDSYLLKLCQWIESKKKRKIKIHIDNYDVWSMDSTLALIIHPMLIKLKEQKHGIGFIDNSDVPDNIKDTDNTYTEEKYNWFLDELIWAFDYLKGEESYNFDLEKEKRCKSALLLFGKYYRTLWD